MTWYGCPSTVGKVARKTSWRRTISLRLCSSAVTLSGPVRCSGGGNVVDNATRLELVEEPEPLLGIGEGDGCGPLPIHFASSSTELEPSPKRRRKVRIDSSANR